MDPGRHHDFLGSTDDRSNRNTYYGREIPEITSHHYYGAATANTRTGAAAVVSNNPRKPCGCAITGSGGSSCNNCQMNPTDDVGWSHAMTNANQMDNNQRTAGAVGPSMGMPGDYHHRMVAESNVRSNVRQNTMYVQQLPHQQHTQQMQQQPTHCPSMIQTQQHTPHVGSMAGNRTTNYWPLSSAANSSSMHYGSGGGGGGGDGADELISAHPTRNNPVSHDYGLYKSTSMPTNVTYANQHSSSSNSNNNNNSSVSGYQLPSSSLNTSNNSLHQRVSAIGSGGLSAAAGPVSASPFMIKERIYEQQKYSSPTTAATAKMAYNTASASNIYESHHHHHLNNQVIAKNLPVDHHVINPSNLPASKEQHPSPNYARKCPQMYAPEEQSTAHQHLYMSTPQFSSEKFTRASPQQPQPPLPSDYTKLRESPSGSSYLVAPHSSPLLHPSHLRESPQFPSHTTSSPRNPSSYYGASQTQNPSKIHPPEMSPIIMKQTHQTHHYQYSKSPLPPPLPPSHMQQQHQTIPPNSSLMAAKSQTSLNVTQPQPPALNTHTTPQHSQRYLLDSVKREDLEIYENPNQTSSRHSTSGSIYINPYNTPPPTGDNCCKEVALSAASSPYAVTGSATPNYRVESPQFYPTKYAKLALNENLSASKQHSLINQNTPPPSRAPSQRGQHQSNYYYEGNSHSAPSPAAATAASPSPSALLTTTSQTTMHHTEYMSSSLQTAQTIGPPPTSQLVGSANMPQSYANQSNLTAQTHHMQQQQPATAALRNNDVMITTTSSHPYERAIQQPSAPSIGAQPHLKVKQHVTHPSSTSFSPAGPVSALQQMQQASSNAAKSLGKHQKPNYRELINQKLAMRNATSEEELNMQIIKKTLNVDTQNMRQPPPPPPNINQLPLTGNKRGTAAMPTPQLQATERIPASTAIGEPNTNLKQTAPVLITHSNPALTMPAKARMINLPEAIPQRISIKQEDAKPSSSSSSTTSSSPLDLSMRTVKTKADSTDYKYQQRPRLPTAATSTTSSEGRYTLPRVDSTPIFSVHAFEPGAAPAAAAAVTNPIRQPNSRNTSLERRNYTPPTQQVTHNSSPVSSASTGYPHSSTLHIPSSPTHHHQHQQYAVGGNFGSTRRNDLPPQPANTIACYENSLVIKAAPAKLNSLSNDIVARPLTITAPAAQIQRPSVVETNPFATVIKIENKHLNETPPHSPHPTIAAAERLPTDTSIMALPSRNPYGVVRSAIQTNHIANAHISSSNSASTPSNYTLACEKNPNFLGRKRHLQEYSQQMSLNEPEAKHKRYLDITQTPTKPQISMRPADITVIAVNDLLVQESQEGKSIKTKTEEFSNSASVIASTSSKSPINKAKVIVNNTKTAVSNCSPTSSSGVVVGMVCKQEPLTPTQEHTNLPIIKTNEMPTNSFSSRIRTKAELKGFTFNPPLPPTQFVPDNNNSPSATPNKLITIKQEEKEEAEDLEELIPAEKIKEEIVTKIELPSSIPGLDDDYDDKNVLDLGWSKTCNNLVEQLLSRPLSKKKTNNIPLLNANKTLSKETEMKVTPSELVTSSTTTKLPLDNHSLSNMESADNTTRSSFNRLDAGVESSITLNNLNQDSINSPGSVAFMHKKLSKTEREKKRLQQEKRLAERLKDKDTSSETEDELDKRKTERLKKPNMKTKHKLKSSPKTGNTTNSNTSSSNGLKDKSRFTDCGSDTSSTGIDAKDNPSFIQLDIKQEQPEQEEAADETKDKANVKININEKCDINEQKMDKKEDDKFKKKSISNNNKKPKEEKSVIKKVLSKNKEKEIKQRHKETKNVSTTTDDEEGEDKNQPDVNSTSKQQTKNKTPPNTINRTKRKQETNNSSNTSDEEQEEEESSEKNYPDMNSHSKQTKNKQALNTMTRSKRKQELEQQLANSKVLRNDKVIRNFSNSNSTNKIKRKYTRKYNTVNSLLESGGLSRESGIIKSTRLRAKLEKNGGKLNLIKTNKIKTNKKNSPNPESKTRPENVHERNVLDLYRFKRALKVPPSLINIKHPGNHKIAASLPDLERHAEALEAYVKKREKNNLKTQNKLKSSKTTNTSCKLKTADKTTYKKLKNEEPKSIIDLLHSRVTNASGVNVRNKTTTTTAVYRPLKPCCSISTNNLKTPLSNNNNNCGMFSETSQTTESSELQMLPELKKDSDQEEDNNDGNESNTNNGGKKRHFSIFDTKVLPAKTRTESKLQQKKENIREIFVGDDRPASAPLPEMTQILDSNEKMTYEQKYEQFLQQMNIVVSADTLGRLGCSAQKKKLSHTHIIANGKPEEVDTESTSVIDADELKDDHHKILPNHFRKRRGKYLRRKGSSGFDYIRKKKKPSTATNAAHHNNHTHHHHNHCNPFGRNEMYDMDEYEHKIKTEDDVSREIQKWVLNKGVGQSAMHKAARQGYIDVIVYCLDRMGMNPDQKDNAGYTPLHEACTNGWLNIARVLLQYGANHSEAAHSGIRPLHEASENDHEELVRLLLSYGADPLLATYAGQTPLMLASSKTMRDILSNHLVDVQSMGPERKPWRFNGSWELYDPSECGYNVFEGAPNSVCDMSRALLRKNSLNNNQIYPNNKKLLNVLHNNNSTNTINATATTTTTTTTATAAITTTTETLTNNFSITSTSSSCQSANNGNNNNNNNPSSSTSRPNLNSGGSSSSNNITTGAIQSGSDAQQQQEQEPQLKSKGETNTKTVMEKCAVVLDNIDRFNSVRLYNDNKPEILVENSDSDGEMFEFEEADVLLPPLYLLKDEGTQDKWVLLNDLCNLLKVKSKDTLLNKIYPSTTSSSSASAASAHKSHMRELKMSDFLEKATCLQLLCAGEKLNICASKVVLIKYNENVRNLLGVKTILMKF